MEKTVTIIKVRDGLNGYPYSACTEAGDLLNEHSYTEVEAMTGISRSTLTRARRQQRAGIDI